MTNTETRNTIQKQIILNAVKELNIHASAEQVYEYIIKTHPTISKTTVYRNMKQLADSGKLLNIGIHHGATHYDHNCREHYHFICDDCQKIFDVDNFPFVFSEIRNKIESMGGFKISNCQLSFTGLCPICKHCTKE
ncbi:MAG: transcriptional repressor [Oscillospiraceae bacterium]|nr:transcriptional repressor [Oscillospiraceae bacterium]